MSESRKLNEKQAAALQQLKSAITDLTRADLQKDAILLRWLEATNFNAKKSEEMIRQNIIWRQKTGADTILEDWEPPQILKDYYACGSPGFDKEGNPVWMDLIGRRDYKGLLHSSMKSDIIKYEIYIMERELKVQREQSAKLGKEINQSMVILDLDKMGLHILWKPGVDTYNAVMTMLETNYPGGSKAVLVINAPRFFPVLYAMIKPFLSADTKSKLRILGSNWKKELLDVIDADQLPVNWGGTQTGADDDPFCKSKICIGGEIPKTLYKKNIEQTGDRASWCSITVPSKDTHLVEMEVVERNSIIRWEFVTDDHDVGFGVFRKTDAQQKKISEMQVVRDIERVNSHMVPQSGVLTLEEPGTYVLVFDNSFSWTKGKKIQYNIDVLKPEPPLE